MPYFLLCELHLGNIYSALTYLRHTISLGAIFQWEPMGFGLRATDRVGNWDTPTHCCFMPFHIQCTLSFQLIMFPCIFFPPSRVRHHLQSLKCLSEEMWSEEKQDLQRSLGRGNICVSMWKSFNGNLEYLGSVR